MAARAGDAWKDIANGARARHQAFPVRGRYQPEWSEVGDAVYLASLISRGTRSDPPPTNASGDELPKHEPSPRDQEPHREPEPPGREPAPAPPHTRWETPTSAQPPRYHEIHAGAHAPALAVAAQPGPPLPDAADILRVLRPLRRKIDSRNPENFVLDEEATAERAVRDDLWLPVTIPAKERWLDLSLVIDASPSMGLWRPVVAAFENLLSQLGAFRTIQRRHLDTHRSLEPTLRGAAEGSSPRPFSELLDPSGRRVVLVLTDGVAGNWQSGPLSTMLATWGRRLPVILIHLLPQQLWPQTRLNPRRASLKPPGRLVPNSRWAVDLPGDWLAMAETKPMRNGCVAVPVLELGAEWLVRVTQLILGNHPPVNTPVFLAKETAELSTGGTEKNSHSSTAGDDVRGFLRNASPAAKRLAPLLAAIPVTMRNARRIQTDVIPGARPEHIAEVLSSGLFDPDPTADADSPPDVVTFNVREAARAELLSNARRSDTVWVIRRTIPDSSLAKAVIAPDDAPLPSVRTVTFGEIGIERGVLLALSGDRYRARVDQLTVIESGLSGDLRRTGSPPERMEPVANNVPDVTDTPFVLERGGVSEPQKYVQVPATTQSPIDQPQRLSVDPGISVLQWRPDLGERGGPGTTPPIWGDVPPRNLNFTGREDLLAALDAQLRAGGPAVVVPQALYGMGGIGKTQTAIEYVYRHLDDYDVVWWIDAAQATQIRSSLTELAGRLGLPGGTEANTAVPAVREALRLGKPYTRWLLVFDAAESVDTIKEFFPTVSANGSGDILITSRNPDWQSLASPLEVSTFDRSESIELLRRRGPDIEEEDADRLADTLGDLPLAIEQAATWRAETGMPVDEYLRLFDEKMVEILGTMAPANYELPVAAAWNVAFDALRTRNPAAHQMLQICGFFSSEPISRQIFSGVRDSIAPEIDRALRDPMELSRAIRDIRRYGLAKIDHRTKTIQLHRLVQMVLRNRMGPEQQGETLHAAHRLLANYDPRDPNSSTNWERYRDLLPHVYASNLIECPDPWARQLVVNLERYLYRWGDHDEAMNLAERTLAHWRKTPGEEDKLTLEVAIDLGYYYWVTGQYEQAAPLNRRTLEIRTRVDGENSEEALAARISVAHDYKAKGDFGTAVQMSAEVFQKATALFAEDDPLTLQFARQHAVNLRLVGEYRQAAKLDTDTYARLIEVVGSEHTETLSALSGLVIDRREAGEYLWARVEQEKLAEQAQRIHGADSADALRRLAYLAVARRKAGDHEGALELSTEVLNRFQIRYGPGNFNALACALSKSIDLRHAGDLRAAKKLGEDAMTQYQRTMGEDHPYTKCSEVDLAVTLRSLGDPAAARAINERAAEALRNSLGADHPYSILCTINLASDVSALGQTDEAIALTTDAVERSERVLGPDHPTTLAANLNLVIDLRTVGREQDAEKRYVDVLARYRNTLGPEHRATVNAGRGTRADCDIDPLPM